MSDHNAVHLRVDEDLDGKRTLHRVFLLRTVSGGWHTIHARDLTLHAVCKTYRPTRVVDRSDLDKVTCNGCKKYIARFIR